MAMTKQHTTTREYRVEIYSWEVHEIWVCGISEDHAKETAELIWRKTDSDAFRCCDGDINRISVVDRRE